MVVTWFVLLYHLGDLASGANILVLQATASGSHSLWIDQFCQLLAERHQVTVLDATDQVKLDHKNVTRFRLENSFNLDPLLLDQEHCSTKDSVKHLLDIIVQLSVGSCASQLWSPTMKRFMEGLKSRKPFDLVLNDGANCEAFLALVEVLGRPPLIRLLPMELPYALEPAGCYDNPAYVTHFMQAHYTYPMSFLQRVENTLYALYSQYVYAGHLKVQEEEARRFFGSGLPPLRQIMSHTRLTLLNTHSMLNPARHLPPNVIDIAGFHIRPPKPLDKNIQSFIESAHHGVVYFSLGTKFLSTAMKEDKRRMFIEVFKGLRQKVLWKWEDVNSTNMPSNVLTSKWFPQADILAHPNVKLFITHAGLLGTQEAIYYGVPMVAIPFSLDQHANSMKIDKLGYGIKLPYSTITARKTINAVEKIVYNKSFSKRIKAASRLFRDQPMTPRDKVTYWIDYVLRHNDLKHLRPPSADMPLYQILLVDVIAFIFVTLSLILIAICYATKSIYTCSKRVLLKHVITEKKNK